MSAAAAPEEQYEERCLRETLTLRIAQLGTLRVALVLAAI